MDARTLPWPIMHRLAARAQLEDRSPGTGTPVEGCFTGALMMRSDGRLALVTTEGVIVEPIPDWDTINTWDDL